MNICSNKLCFLTTDVTLNLTSCALRHFRFMLIRHLIKTGAGIGLPLKSKAIQTPLASFFLYRRTRTPLQWWAVWGYLRVGWLPWTPVRPTPYSPPPARLVSSAVVTYQRLRRLPIWLLSLPQLILNLSGAFTPAKNVTITSLLHQQKMRLALSFLTPHVFSLPVFPLIHAILSVTGASLLTLLLRRDYENVISHP